MKDIIYNIHIILALFTIGYCAYQLYYTWKNKAKIDRQLILTVFWLITAIYYSELFIQSNL